MGWGWGALSQGALWSHTVYEKYLHAFTTLGPGTPKRPVGTWRGAARPSAPQMVTPGPSLGLSVNLYSVGFYLQSPRLGRHILGESQDSLGSHPAPKAMLALLSAGAPAWRPGGRLSQAQGDWPQHPKLCCRSAQPVLAITHVSLTTKGDQSCT